MARQQAIDDFAHQAPPLYGEHQFDRLYSDIDISGYRTPGPTSGSATPFGALSRNISSDDLESLEAITSGDISASALHSRLSHLHATRGTISSSPGTLSDNHDSDHGSAAHDHTADYFTPSSGRQSNGNSHPQSPENISRRGSDDHEHELPDSSVPSGVVTPHQPQYLEVETLSRVPSYTTAIRSNARTQYDSELPDYDHAILSAAPAPAPRPLPPPQQGHIRSSGTSSPVRMPTLNETLHQSIYGCQADDEERRLRLAQARVNV